MSKAHIPEKSLKIIFSIFTLNYLILKDFKSRLLDIRLLISALKPNIPTLTFSSCLSKWSSERN